MLTATGRIWLTRDRKSLVGDDEKGKDSLFCAKGARIPDSRVDGLKFSTALFLGLKQVVEKPKEIPEEKKEKPKK